MEIAQSRNEMRYQIAKLAKHTGGYYSLARHRGTPKFAIKVHVVETNINIIYYLIVKCV